MGGSMTETGESDNAAADLIEAGSAITGAAAGAAIDLLGGPPGVIGGAAAGAGLSVVIRRLAGEMRNRVLGPREVERIGAAIGYALVDINERLAAGEVPRRDGFFEIPTDNVHRSAADEIYEGVLIAAQGEYEERKLALYGRLLASVAFRDGISRAHANYLIRMAKELSYRQICLLALACRSGVGFPTFNGIALEDARAAEIEVLHHRHLLRDDPNARDRLIAWSNGIILCEMMDLNRVTDDEISAVASISMTRHVTDHAGAQDSIG